MKKILLSLLLVAIYGLVIKSYSQVTGCTGGASSCHLIPQDVKIGIVQRDCDFDGNANKTEIIFDIQFKIEANDGNKVIYLHSWLKNEYPAGIGTTYFQCGGSGTENGFTAGAPGFLGTAIDQASRSIIDIGLDNAASLAVGTEQVMAIKPTNGYAPDPTVVLISPNGPSPNAPGMTAKKTLLANGLDSISLTNVRIVVNKPCYLPEDLGAIPPIPANTIETPIIVETLIWASNASGAVKAQCWAANIVQAFNDPFITGFKNCNRPRQYALGISTTESTPSTLTYSVWIDVDLSGDISTGDLQVVGPATYPNFSSTNPYSSGGPVTYPVPLPYTNGDKDLIITATTNLIANSIYKVFPHPAGCIGLPVDFKSFTAARNRSNVNLKWETMTERNCEGFAIDRNVGGAWEQIAFVPSKGQNGNSDDLLAYTYVDMNQYKGISQYRIRQVDLDSRSKYSEIRSVRGEGQPGKTIVYPNPTNDGRVNIVFEETNVSRNVSVMDMSGRLIKQWRAVTNNNLTIDNLTPGMYSLRIVAIETGEQTVEKIVVNKR